MANHLVRLTQNDYRDYRRTCSKISYSFHRDGDDPEFIPYELIRELSNKEIMGKGDFLNFIESSNIEMYFLKNSDEQIIGFVCFKFSDKDCYIAEFAVFEKRKGLGSELFELSKDIMKARGCNSISLSCPFLGSQEFWRKMGFYPKFHSMFEFERSIKFAR